MKAFGNGKVESAGNKHLYHEILLYRCAKEDASHFSLLHE